MCLSVLSCGSGESDEDNISFSKRIESSSITSKDNSITFDPLQTEQSHYGINMAVAKQADISIYKKYVTYYTILIMGMKYNFHCSLFFFLCFCMINT